MLRHAINRKRTNEECGKIYCHSPTEFTIHCAFCELRTNEYEVFLLHIKIIHLNFCNPLQTCEDRTSELDLKFGISFEKQTGGMSDTNCLVKSKVEDMPIKNVEEIVGSDGWLDCQKKEAYNMYPRNEKETEKTNKQYSCEYCGNIYKTVTYLKNHITLEHEGNDLSSSSRVKCTECFAEFPNQPILNKHSVNEHNGIKCPFCHRKFKRRADQMRHTAEKHTNCSDAKFECDFENCLKRFYTKNHLAYHKRIHMRAKNFVCDVCGFSCQAGNTLRVHYRTHTDEKPFSCNVCYAKFRLKHHLERHSDIHTRGNERNFVCDMDNCKKSFFTGRRLEAHIRRHSMPKKYVCSVCSYSSKHNQSLQFHYRKHTAEELECKSKNCKR